MGWQKTFTLAKRSKGCHLVTDEVLAQIEPGLRGVQVGVLYLFIQHTSAALTINENFDKALWGALLDVVADMDMALDNIVPESLNWRHTDEGPDVSHTKTSLVGTSICLPITDGRLNLGTWQGIYLTEFRHAPHSRRIVATILYVVYFLYRSAGKGAIC
ncbi:hypothetical protein DICSQDRAFT_96079 [Dichomitus squalens LYAD-421 SS1]|uniref:uncharacterized protein n=1 Tax=Dichomitus squalens (strain LYAD-421) TaxID=732165 RepID=UPI000441598B|nr:uncharacterized protein DICSQDRAFT_96079 [Dichomitus squalens LYAD-421 SS1]EJF67043.1 hypothetical protein DICSQDRAFT_96079 [Dichomitus squalens LYAD-421 SS1]